MSLAVLLMMDNDLQLVGSVLSPILSIGCITAVLKAESHIPVSIILLIRNHIGWAISPTISLTFSALIISYPRTFLFFSDFSISLPSFLYVKQKKWKRCRFSAGSRFWCFNLTSQIFSNIGKNNLQIYQLCIFIAFVRFFSYLFNYYVIFANFINCIP